MVSYDDLVAAGSMQVAKARGKVRLEGKDYVMADGDVVEFRFNVLNPEAFGRHHLMLKSMHAHDLNLDDDLVRRACELTGRTEKAALVRLGLEALITQESSRRLAALAAVIRKPRHLPVIDARHDPGRHLDLDRPSTPLRSHAVRPAERRAGVHPPDDHRRVGARVPARPPNDPRVAV